MVLSPHFIEIDITEEIAVKKFARKSSFYQKGPPFLYVVAFMNFEKKSGFHLKVNMWKIDMLRKNHCGDKNIVLKQWKAWSVSLTFI